MQIRLCQQDDAASMRQFYLHNADHLLPCEPQRDPHYHREVAWQARLVQWARLREEGRAANFIALDRDKIIAVCNISNIVRGVFQAGNLGYAVAADFEGKGVMYQVCGQVIEYAFESLSLNRLMANYMPANERSGKLLSRLGFEREGLAKRYLYINGRWEDHVLTALLNNRAPIPASV
jgi:ribosomal-protein-alanine N-acetyltransferase